jgi:uncharacterized membrane protein
MTPHEQSTALAAAVAAPHAGHGTGTVALLIAATVLTGLLAGTYFAYACSVMLALGRTSDRTFIEVMQKIDVAIQNPVFFAALFGAPACTAIAVGLEASEDRGAPGWTIAALALNLVSLLITIAANVPLNNRLAAAGDPAMIADPGAVRRRFEGAWNSWNTARGSAAIAALICLGLALRGR